MRLDAPSTSFERIALASHDANRIPSSCCQQAVANALDATGAMGVIAVVAFMTSGFAMGLAVAWVFF